MQWSIFGFMYFLEEFLYWTKSFHLKVILHSFKRLTYSLTKFFWSVLVKGTMAYANMKCKHSHLITEDRIQRTLIWVQWLMFDLRWTSAFLKKDKLWWDVLLLLTKKKKSLQNTVLKSCTKKKKGSHVSVIKTDSIVLVLQRRGWTCHNLL